jgi:hypothetical protein
MRIFKFKTNKSWDASEENCRRPVKKISAETEQPQLHMLVYKYLLL